MKVGSDREICIDSEDTEHIAERYRVMEFIEVHELVQCGTRMQCRCECDKPASHRQAGFARFAGEAKGTQAIVQIVDRFAEESAAMRCATEYGIDEQRFSEAVFYILRERLRTATHG